MIINLRGTSGSGKTTIVKHIMAQFAVREPVFTAGRKQPLYYRLWHDPLDFQAKKDSDLVVLGHYETACGGCDSLPTTDLVCNLVYELSGQSTHVLFEGLLFSAAIGRAIEFHEVFGKTGFCVVALSTPLDECLASVNQRRWAKDPTKPPVNPVNTESKFGAVLRSVEVLQENGANVHYVGRREALARIESIIFDL